MKYLKAYRGGLLSSLGSVDSTTSRESALRLRATRIGYWQMLSFLWRLLCSLRPGALFFPDYNDIRSEHGTVPSAGTEWKGPWSIIECSHLRICNRVVFLSQAVTIEYLQAISQSWLLRHGSTAWMYLSKQQPSRRHATHRFSNGCRIHPSAVATRLASGLTGCKLKIDPYHKP